MSRDTTGRSPAQTEPSAPDAVAEPAAELAAQVGRLADRLRSLSDVRLARPLPPDGSRADAGHGLAQRLADLAAALEGGPVREVPRLHDLAVGDQVQVTGTDLVRALRIADRPVQDRLTSAAEALAAVRRLRDAL